MALLQANTLNADKLRRRLMSSSEFRNPFAEISPEDLHGYRTRLWMSLYDAAIRDQVARTGHWPPALDVYNAALEALRVENRGALKLSRLE